jgi:hypothetical protein
MEGASSVLPNAPGTASPYHSQHLHYEQSELMLALILFTNLLLLTLLEFDSVALLAHARMGAAYFYWHVSSISYVSGTQINIDFRCRHIWRFLRSTWGTRLLQGVGGKFDLTPTRIN